MDIYAFMKNLNVQRYIHNEIHILRRLRRK